jgi:WD40 repeat protein
MIIISGLVWGVCSIVSTHDGKYIVVGDRGNTAVLWDLSGGKEIQRFENLHRMRHQMALSPDERLLGCAEEEDRVVIFDLSSGDKTIFFQGKGELVHCVDFNHDGKKLIIGDRSGYISIVNFMNRETRRLGSKLKSIYQIRHSRKRPQFLVVGSGKEEDVVECWDSETGEKMFSEPCKYSHALSSNHREDIFAVGDIHDGIWIFDSTSGALIHKMKTSRETSGISFSPDDRYLATGHTNATIRIWDVDQHSPSFGQCLKVLDVRMNCRGVKIGGARGLEKNVTWKDRRKPTGHFARILRRMRGSAGRRAKANAGKSVRAGLGRAAQPRHTDTLGARRKTSG